MKKFIWILVVLVLSCSSSPLIRIDIDLAVNQSGNPLKEIDANHYSTNPTSRGIFFRFESMNDPPKSIDDINGLSIVGIPSATTDDGGSATQAEYQLDTSQLLPNTYYKVTMEALSYPLNTVTHQGVGDCPINISKGSLNFTTICFGVYDLSSVPLCPQTTVFSQCPIFTTPAQ